MEMYQLAGGKRSVAVILPFEDEYNRQLNYGKKTDITALVTHKDDRTLTLTTVFLIWVISTVIVPITFPAKRDALVIITAENPHRFAGHLLCKAQSLQTLQKPMGKKCRSSDGFLVRAWELATIFSKLPEGGTPATLTVSSPLWANLNLSYHLKLHPLFFIETIQTMNWYLDYNLQQRPRKEEVMPPGQNISLHIVFSWLDSVLLK